jgi:hypothetical protein
VPGKSQPSHGDDKYEDHQPQISDKDMDTIEFCHARLSRCQTCCVFLCWVHRSECNRHKINHREHREHGGKTLWVIAAGDTEFTTKDTKVHTRNTGLTSRCRVPVPLGSPRCSSAPSNAVQCFEDFVLDLSGHVLYSSVTEAYASYCNRLAGHCRLPAR